VVETVSQPDAERANQGVAEASLLHLDRGSLHNSSFTATSSPMKSQI